jgi:hypothetical protein
VKVPICTLLQRFCLTKHIVIKTQLVEKINLLKNDLQCIVSNFEIDRIEARLALGCTQEPSVFDFADNVNTLDFLKTI